MNDCRTLLRVLTASLLVLALDADSEDCFPQRLVRRNTVYEASVGQELRVNCTIVFCNSSPPTVTWYKVDEKIVPVNMSSNIKTEWKLLEEFEGVSYLIFQNILKSDSGVYRCESEGDVSHNITVSVSVSPAAVHSSCPFLFRLVGIILFVSAMIAIIICVTSKPNCKGKRSTTASRQSSCSLQDIPIYENDL